MYIIKYGDKYLHNPKVGLSLIDVNLDMEENSSGFCDFSLYPGHPLYDVIREKDSDNPVVVYEDEDVLFSGFIYQIGETFDLLKPVKCKGDLAYLGESIVRPYSTRKNVYGSKAPDTVDGYFYWLIKQHNDQVIPSKRFRVGINQGAELDKNNYIYRESKQHPTTLEEISEKIISSLGGFLRVRWEKGIRYIDLIAKWTDKNTQTIRFGENLTDYSNNLDTDSVATYIVPLGAKYEETEYDYDDGYFVTEDTTKDPEKTYYTVQYEGVRNLSQFEEGYVYFEAEDVTFQTGDAEPVKGITYNVYDLTGYYVTSDTAVTEGKSYYTLQYYTIEGAETFEEGVTYYDRTEHVFLTEDTTPVKNVTYYNKVIVAGETQYQLAYSTGEFEPGVEYYEIEYEYFPTTDPTPVSGKTYFVLLYDNFQAAYDLERFLKYETYYEYFEGIYKKSTDINSLYNTNVNLMSVEVSKFDPDVYYYESERRYFITSDTEPDTSKEYYLIVNHGYNEVLDLGRFRYTEIYFEYSEDRDEGKKFIGIAERNLTWGLLKTNRTTWKKFKEKTLYDWYYDGPETYLGDGYYKKRDMIYHKDSVERYGWIGVVYKNEEIHIRENLIGKATEELKKCLSPVLSIDVKAVDMHFLNPELKSIKIGEYVRIVSKPHNLDSYFLCTSITLNLNNPGSSIYSFGAKTNTLTGTVVTDSSQIQANTSSISNLSSEVNTITQIVNKTTSVVNKEQEQLDDLLAKLRSLQAVVADIHNKLTNEINALTQKDNEHDKRFLKVEDTIKMLYMRTISLSNLMPLTITSSSLIDETRFALSFPTKVKVDFECIFDATTNVTFGLQDVYDEIEIEVVYILDGVPIPDRIPVANYLDGRHILKSTYVLDIKDTSIHTFNVQLNVRGGEIRIKQYDALAYLSAQSIRYVWDGIINCYDEVPIHRNMIKIDTIEDETVEFDFTEVKNSETTDYIPYLNMARYFRSNDISDNVETEVSTNA